MEGVVVVVVMVMRWRGWCEWCDGCDGLRVGGEVCEVMNVAVEMTVVGARDCVQGKG